MIQPGEDLAAIADGDRVRVDAIHVGDYKTGSSWLQRQVFLRHPRIAYLDWPETNPAIAALFYELVGARDLDFDAASLARRFNAALAGIDCNGKKRVISREALVGDFISGEHGQRIARRLFQVFGPTRIILVIREQFSMMASMYSEYVKIGGTLALGDFVCDPLVANHLRDRLQYEKLIQTYCDLFGAENVVVKLFDELRADQARFAADILGHLGCADIDLPPMLDASTNPSLTTAGAACQRVLNRFVRTGTNPGANPLPIDKLIAALLTPDQKRRLLESAQVQFPWADTAQAPRAYLLYSINMALNLRLSAACESIRFGRKIVIPEALRDSFRPAFAASNRILVSCYGLRLDQYGWVLP